MSLLMDALKKAEQEKREAAKRLKESEAPSIKEEEETRQEQEGEGASDKENTGEHPAASAPRPYRPSSTLELSLAPIEEPPAEKKPGSNLESRISEDLKIREDDGDATVEDEDLHLNIEAASALAEEGPEMEEREQQEADSSRIEEMDREQSTADPDATFHGLDLDDTMDAPMFEDTVEGEAVRRSEGSGAYDETLPAVSAAQMAEDIGSEDQPTPVAAQTVFTAGMTRNEKSATFKWLLVSAAVVMLIAAGVWYYYTVTPISRELPSPMVARGIESVAPADEATPAVPRVVQSGSLGTGAAPAEQAAEPTAAGQPEAAPGGSMTGAAETGAPVEAAAETPAPPEAPAETESAGAAVPEAPAVAEEPAAREPDSGAAGQGESARRDAPAAVLPQAIEPPPSLIKISRSKSAPPEAALLRQAYDAYRDGDYAAAREAYGRVLERRPDNRDALLGLAAVALQQDQPQQALAAYARVLELNPRDNLARAALISMSRNTDPARSESAIKLMLREKPEQAYLHFALGNVYAAQSRWNDAQQAFFDAYRLDSGNADYALNLAVSLDHLGKPDTALDYYQTALQLAGDGGSNFDSTALKNRIETLEGARQP